MAPPGLPRSRRLDMRIENLLLRVHTLPLLAAVLAANALAAEPYVHVVESGQTLIGIAQSLLQRPADWPQLQRINRIDDPRRLQPGQRLRIPLGLLRAAERSVEIVHLTGTLTVDGRVPAVGERLRRDATITVADGGGTLRFEDGTEVLLAARTRLRLQEVSQSPATQTYNHRLELEQGALEAHVPNADGGRRAVSVRARGAVLGVRGTRFRLAEGEGGRALRAEVTQGRVDVHGGAGRARPLEAGQGLHIVPGTRLGAPQALLPAPDLSALPAEFTRPELRLAFPALPGAARYRVTVSSDPEGRRPLQQQLSEQPVARFAGLPDGDYWVGARALASDGMEGLDALAPLRLAARPEAPFPQQPGEKSRAASTAFAWARVAEAVRYELRIGDDPGCGGTSATHPVADGDFPTLALAPGRYHWCVASVDRNGKRGPFSDPRMLDVLPPQAAVDRVETADGQMNFAWPGEAGQRFEFELARDAGFTDIAIRRQVDEARIALPTPPSGTYHVRVRATDSDGFTGAYSAPQRVEVPGGAPWWLLLLLLPAL